MKITVMSGKGGTGKTTAATNMALSLKNVQFLDADVEEPNASIFLKPEFFGNSEKAWRNIPDIEQNKCSGCRSCIEFCEYNALARLGEKIIVYPEVCSSCGGCKIICPENVIKVKKRQVGEITGGRSTFNSRSIDFWQGKLTVGEASAVPLIAQLKKKINKNKMVIIDAPPGATCPTIESASDSDFIILVTEPTPFGLHDLKIAVELAQKLGNPYGVIINRSQPKADNIIEDFCRDKQIDILLKIPFSREIAELYSRGIPFITEMKDWQDKFQQIMVDIKEITA